MPHRSRRIAIVAHCHLNANTKVHGLADYGSTRDVVLARIAEEQAGIVQLPCPEITALGMRRWGMTVEQYDTRAYRRHCVELLEPVIDTLVALHADGCEFVGVFGVEGSPSCGVDVICSGYTGGEIEDALASSAPPHAQDAPGPGVFMQEFVRLLEEAGLVIPFFGVNERVEPDAPAS
ncbi:MAG: DUF523 domain-containing protein [Coriobacteriia bacterium]